MHPLSGKKCKLRPEAMPGMVIFIEDMHKRAGELFKSPRFDQISSLARSLDVSECRAGAALVIIDRRYIGSQAQYTMPIGR
jgi:hypothetical protein